MRMRWAQGDRAHAPRHDDRVDPIVAQKKAVAIATTAGEASLAEAHQRVIAVPHGHGARAAKTSAEGIDQIMATACDDGAVVADPICSAICRDGVITSTRVECPPIFNSIASDSDAVKAVMTPPAQTVPSL